MRGTVSRLSTHARISPFTIGSNAWHDWWGRRGMSERVRSRDGPVFCASCRCPAIVLNCLHGRDALEHPQVERWCRCDRCGSPWRDLTTLVDRGGKPLADIESPIRRDVIGLCLSEASRSNSEDGDPLPERGDRR